MIATVTLASMLTLAGTASADGPVNASSEGGSATATYTWAGPGSMNNIDLKVADTRCDTRGSYAKFVFIRRDHGTKETDARWNRIGCNKTQGYNDLSWSDGFDTDGFYLVSCTDSNSNDKEDDGDQCGSSATIDNPLS
ncbi:MAG: hypothetical protein ACRDSZ_05675 [Pseudonocardiaceae bacterium]